VGALLDGAIDTVAGDHTPRGCLTAHGALAVGPRSQPAREFLAVVGRNKVGLLTDRLRTFHDCGELPEDCDPSALAQLLMTIINGLSIKAAAGASREELRLIADQMTTLMLPRTSGPSTPPA